MGALLARMFHSLRSENDAKGWTLQIGPAVKLCKVGVRLRTWYKTTELRPNASGMKPHSKPRSPLRHSRESKRSSKNSAEYGAHSVQVSGWKKTLLGRTASVFDKGAQAGAPEGLEKERAEWRETIGKLNGQSGFPEKRSKQLGLCLGMPSWSKKHMPN